MGFIERILARDELRQAKKERTAYRDELLSVLLHSRNWVYSLKKSGTTYTLLVLANYLSRLSGREENTAFDEMPEFGVIHSIERKLLNSALVEAVLRQNPDRTAIHTHKFVPAAYRKAILLMRNPLDYLVSSYFFHYKHRGIEVPIMKTVAKSISKYAEVHRNQTELLRQRPEDTLLLFYEDLINKPEASFESVVRHLCWPLDHATLQSSMAASSKDKVKETEERLGGAIVASGNYRAKSFIRSGEIGEWRAHFSRNEADSIRKQLKAQGIDPEDVRFPEF